MSLSAIIQLVNNKMRSDALAELASADLVASAVGLAMLQYSADKPLSQAGLVEAEEDLTDSLAVPEGWVPDVSILGLVEFPVGLAPMSTLPASLVRPLGGGDRIMLLLDSLPAGSQARVHFTGPHAADGSTVPDAHRNPIACWAAAELCRQAASRAAFDRDATLSAIQTNQSSQSAELSRRAKDWAAQYYAQLGMRNPDATGTNSSADLGSGVAAAGTVVSLGGDGHRRGRFSSQGY